MQSAPPLQDREIRRCPFQGGVTTDSRGVRGRKKSLVSVSRSAARMRDSMNCPLKGGHHVGAQRGSGTVFRIGKAQSQGLRSRKKSVLAGTVKQFFWLRSLMLPDY